MRKIKVAHIGCNKYSHATQIFGEIKAQSDLFEIVGYALPEDEAITAGAERLAVFEGYPLLTVEQILGDAAIEAVIVVFAHILLF